jgi:hypothetical protein
MMGCNPQQSFQGSTNFFSQARTALNAANNIQARLIGTSGVVMGSNRTRNHAGSMTSR